MGTPRTDEGQAAVPPTAAEMGGEAPEQTVREQLVAALDRTADSYHRHWCPDKIAFKDCKYPVCSDNRLALDRARTEPVCADERCGTDCPCYQAGANEGHSSGCNDDSCVCWEAGHAAGLEAQRERVGGGTA